MKGKKLKYRLVSYAVVEQYKWERDIAISQLEELGIGFGENPKLKAIPIDWIKDYIKHINRLDLEYEPNTCDLDDVVKQEIERMVDEYESDTCD